MLRCDTNPRSVVPIGSAYHCLFGSFASFLFRSIRISDLMDSNDQSIRAGARPLRISDRSKMNAITT
jgi:hypothetical protein